MWIGYWYRYVPWGGIEFRAERGYPMVGGFGKLGRLLVTTLLIMERLGNEDGRSHAFFRRVILTNKLVCERFR